MRYNTLSVLTALALFLNIEVKAQNHVCGTDYHTEHLIEQGLLSEEVLDPTSLPSSSNRGPASGPYIIPVVVHIIHDNGIGNISDEQVMDGLRILNEDFNRMNADTSQTRSIYAPYAAGLDVEFRLAQVDPDGNCTNGINRINDSQNSYLAENNVKFLSNANWSSANGRRYLQFWLVNTIAEWSPNGIILGYAEFPTNSFSNTWGVVARNDTWGTIGTSNADGRTITHEVGHCFRLYHTFQGGCTSSCNSGGDGVCDTPQAPQSTQGCNSGLQACSSAWTDPNSPYFGMTNLPRQIENYMSYDDCQNMFTQGQVSRMSSALDNLFIDKLWSTSNLELTGVSPLENSLCESVIDADQKTVCVGTPVQFSEETYHNPESFQWNFPGGVVDSDTSRTPTVVYSEPGVYSVSLTVSAGAQQINVSETDFITVLPLGSTSPLIESFEFNNLEDDFWSYSNYNFDYNWKLTSNAASAGSQSLMIANSWNSRGEATIYSPSYDLSNLFSANVTFDMAYASRTGSEIEQLKIYVSGDCGQTWKLKWGNIGPNMTTTNNTGASYYPDPSDWVEEDFTLSNDDLTRNTRFKIVFGLNGGNNVFIDNINITGLYSNVPALREPLDGALDVHPHHKLDWNSTVISQQYEIEADVTPDFNSPQLRTAATNWQGAASNGPDTEVQFNTLWDAGQTYYWRVRSSSNGNAGQWSETWSFTAGQVPSGVFEEAIDSFDFSVYPNPTHDNFMVDNLSGTERIVITDLTGRVIHEVKAANDRVFIEASGWKAGVYLVRVYRGDRTTTQHIIKQ